MSNPIKDIQRMTKVLHECDDENKEFRQAPIRTANATEETNQRLYVLDKRVEYLRNQLDIERNERQEAEKANKIRTYILFGITIVTSAISIATFGMTTFRFFHDFFPKQDSVVSDQSACHTL